MRKLNALRLSVSGRNVYDHLDALAAIPPDAHDTFTGAMTYSAVPQDVNRNRRQLNTTGAHKRDGGGRRRHVRAQEARDALVLQRLVHVGVPEEDARVADLGPPLSRCARGRVSSE